MSQIDTTNKSILMDSTGVAIGSGNPLSVNASLDTADIGFSEIGLLANSATFSSAVLDLRDYVAVQTSVVISKGLYPSLILQRQGINCLQHLLSLSM